MKGIELSRAFYEDYCKEMISKNFHEYENRIAVGIAGRGSECFGFDDEISTDHDFKTGVCLWLKREDFTKIGNSLQKAYNELPCKGESIVNPNVKDKFGVHTIDEFFVDTIGTGSIPKTYKQWFDIPEYALAESVNGEIFRDDSGEMLLKRLKLIAGPGIDIKRKKIAAYLALSGQAGQYNYYRALKRKDQGAMKLVAYEFVINTIHLIFWLNNRYCPYYKWMFRALSELPKLNYLEKDLLDVLDGNDDKRRLIEEISWEIVLELKKQNLTNSNSVYLEDHAYAVTEGIKDEEIKSMHVMISAE
ncbi:MAG: DUF4037 domain-containing protein [Peptostreptococcaceae bacterium]|nr:DUF4037 domain-containing protein [Peptostreptococcaceae bacterium]